MTGRDELVKVLLSSPHFVGSDEDYWLHEAEHILASDWLAAHDAAIRERIAWAIETFLDPDDCDDSVCESCALIRQLATVVRASGPAS